MIKFDLKSYSNICYKKFTKKLKFVVTFVEKMLIQTIIEK